MRKIFKKLTAISISLLGWFLSASIASADIVPGNSSSSPFVLSIAGIIILIIAGAFVSLIAAICIIAIHKTRKKNDDK